MKTAAIEATGTKKQSGWKQLRKVGIWGAGGRGGGGGGGWGVCVWGGCREP